MLLHRRERAALKRRLEEFPVCYTRLTYEHKREIVGEVAEITHLLTHLRHWPPGLRVFVRRVKPLRDTTPKPLPGTGQLELDLRTRAAGWRYEAFATNAPTTQPDEHPEQVTAGLDGSHRVHARVEMREARCVHRGCRSWSSPSSVGGVWLSRNRCRV